MERIYDYSDVFHCEVIEKVAYDFIIRNNLDNISSCKYEVPGFWEIGEVFERLIEVICDESEVFKTIREVYSSWLDDKYLISTLICTTSQENILPSVTEAVKYCFNNYC